MQGNITDSLENLVTKPPVLPEQASENPEMRMQAIRQQAQPDHDPYVEDEPDPMWLQAVMDNEFWTRDIAGNAWTSTKNMAANIVGLPGDIISLALMIRAADPYYGPMIKQQLGVDSAWDIMRENPIGSDKFAEYMGGDPDHPSMIATGLVAPGPVEFLGFLKGAGTAALPTVKAMLPGVFAARNLAKAGDTTALTTLEEFLKLDEVANGGEGFRLYDQHGYDLTGWYKGEEGLPRFFLSDKGATFSLDKAYKKFDEIASTKEVDSFGGEMVYLKVKDVMDHPKLYQAYPQLAEMQIGFSIVKKDGQYFVRSRTKSQGGRMSTIAGNPTRMELFNITRAEDLKKFILHESQHVVQRVEGFATGASTQHMADEVIDNFIVYRAGLEAIQVVDEGADTFEALEAGLRAKGWSKAEVDAILNDSTSPATEYLSWTWDNNIEEMSRIKAEVAGAVNKEADDLVHLLHYLGLNKEDAAATLAEELGEKLRYTDVAKLKRQAYLHAAGEAEARLVELLSDFDRMPLVPNPRIGATEGHTLSVGKIAEPGVIVPSEFADIPVVTLKQVQKVIDDVPDDTTREVLQKVLDNDPEILAKWLRMQEGLDPNVVSREASDPMANWHQGQNSARGDQNWGGALDVPNESKYTGASKLPEGTHEILSADEMRLLANIGEEDPGLVKRLMDELGVEEVADSDVIDFESRALARDANIQMDKIKVLEDSIHKNAPMEELFRQAQSVLNDDSLRPMMSTDRIDELDALMTKWQKGNVEYAAMQEELIEFEEDILREVLERHPDVENVDIEDILEGIQEWPF